MINLLEYVYCLKLVLIFDIFITIYFYFTVEYIYILEDILYIFYLYYVNTNKVCLL